MDRRARKHTDRREALLATAAELIERNGVAGFTLAALAEAADYAPTSLYTYFPSRSALFAELQRRALATLGAFAEETAREWDVILARLPVRDRRAADLARLVAFSRLFVTAPEHHPYEFRLQQQLLVTPNVEEPADVAAVVPAALAVLAVPRRLLEQAVKAGVLDAHDPLLGPNHQPFDVHTERTLAWVVALNGGLLLNEVPFDLSLTGAQLGEILTDSLLRAWGATPMRIKRARELADQLVAGPLP
jgi:AcrR family transcriptional regulator